MSSGAIFVKSKHTKRFREGFHTFCPNLHRFCPDFKGFFPGCSSNQIFWQWASTPCTPTSYTTCFKFASKNFHATPVDARKSRFVPNTHDPFCLKCYDSKIPSPLTRPAQHTARGGYSYGPQSDLYILSYCSGYSDEMRNLTYCNVLAVNYLPFR